MKNRVSKYPGRVVLIPVSGQTNTYNMRRADDPVVEGTPYDVANVLPDELTKQYGLNPDDSTVAQVLQKLTSAAFLNADGLLTNILGNDASPIFVQSYQATGKYPALYKLPFKASFVIISGWGANQQRCITLADGGDAITIMGNSGLVGNTRTRVRSDGVYLESNPGNDSWSSSISNANNALDRDGVGHWEKIRAFR